MFDLDFVFIALHGTIFIAILVLIIIFIMDYIIEQKRKRKEESYSLTPEYQILETIRYGPIELVKMLQPDVLKLEKTQGGILLFLAAMDVLGLIIVEKNIGFEEHDETVISITQKGIEKYDACFEKKYGKD